MNNRFPNAIQASTEEPPVITSVAGKIGTLERRRDFLEGQLEDGRGSPQALQFARAEVQAISAALIALRYHLATVQRLPEPLALLRKMVEAYEGPVDKEGKLRAAVAEAKLLLEEFEA